MNVSQLITACLEGQNFLLIACIPGTYIKN